jgi:NAD(P)-dependent dehydrogenase (short-subunit alcohol dehydrogenase family)
MKNKSPSQLLDFDGKIVLVTGGSSGLGAGIALRFAQAGAAVVVCSRRPADETCQAIQGAGKECLNLIADLTDPVQVTDLFDEITATWGTIDILINNAGIYPVSSLLDTTPGEWAATLDINLTAVFLCTQAAARSMIAAKKGGAVINIGSIEALAPARGHSHYAAAKAGVVMFSRVAALELGEHHIRVNTISPGLINRPGLAAAWPEGYHRFVEQAPLGRVGEPQDIADACLYLASDAARWVTGAHLVVDGGVMSSPIF